LGDYAVGEGGSLLGLGERHLMYLRQDAQQRADCADVEAKLAQCRAERRLPIAIVGIAGSTETGVIDPLPQLAAIAAQHGVHFHVDAAWGGAMIFSERYRGLLAGAEPAHSITLRPHT